MDQRSEDIVRLAAMHLETMAGNLKDVASRRSLCESCLVAFDEIEKKQTRDQKTLEDFQERAKNLIGDLVECRKEKETLQKRSTLANRLLTLAKDGSVYKKTIEDFLSGKD